MIAEMSSLFLDLWRRKERIMVLLRTNCYPFLSRYNNAANDVKQSRKLQRG